jgi:hypothetical protein
LRIQGSVGSFKPIVVARSKCFTACTRDTTSCTRESATLPADGSQKYLCSIFKELLNHPQTKEALMRASCVAASGGNAHCYCGPGSNSWTWSLRNGLLCCPRRNSGSQAGRQAGRASSRLFSFDPDTYSKRRKDAEMFCFESILRCG